MTAGVSFEAFAERFEAEPGYLDFARMGPVGTTVLGEEQAMMTLLAHSRYGTLSTLDEQDARVRDAVAAVIGFDPRQVIFQPNTSQGLMHVMFGLTGEVAVSSADFPSSPFAITRAADALGAVSPRWLDSDHGRITPGNLRDQLTDSTVAVAVSLVDFRTGYVVDLEGIRQVIGDRLLIVDAIQGFGIVDAPFQVADVVVSGGQKWVRAGWGTGFLALSDRAAEHLVPVFSGFSATDTEGTPLDEVPPPTRGVGAFEVSNPDPIAQARFAVALEEIADVGVAVIAARLAEQTARIIDMADEFALDVVSPRDDAERAGIVVVEPAADRLTALTASLHNHGVTVTTRQGAVRLSPHATTDDETFAMLRSSLVAYSV
ncbi:aminotransferase class V-fold PLP-dependent enzyme [Salinibacterium sp.]|uniref:aminotransferase class V-fold PLP-dependent enzyme n=1 Tax=Salinibacterium sp. TaxID=1915057 RepID=UPI00286A14E0|nr:aminotransferase class V-fold PLP-dependent enzyme [Salinibacterium sp.]